MKLTFRLGQTPVTVHASFLIVAILIALPLRDVTVGALLIVILATSVLLHELAHAAVCLRSGVACEIELYAVAGVTRPAQPLSSGRDIVMSLAGPAVNLAIGLPIWLVLDARLVLFETEWIAWAVTLTALCNLYLGIYNLMPVLPLDGGRVLDQLIRLRRPSFGGMARAALNVGLAVVVAGIALSLDQRMLAVLVAAAALHGLFVTTLLASFVPHDTTQDVPGMLLVDGWYVREARHLSLAHESVPRCSWSRAVLRTIGSDLRSPASMMMWTIAFGSIGASVWLALDAQLALAFVCCCVAFFLLRAFGWGGFRVGVHLERNAECTAVRLDNLESLPAPDAVSLVRITVAIGEREMPLALPHHAIQALRRKHDSLECLVAHVPTHPEFGAYLVGLRAAASLDATEGTEQAVAPL